MPTKKKATAEKPVKTTKKTKSENYLVIVESPAKSKTIIKMDFIILLKKGKK